MLEKERDWSSTGERGFVTREGRSLGGSGSSGRQAKASEVTRRGGGWEREVRTRVRPGTRAQSLLLRSGRSGSGSPSSVLNKVRIVIDKLCPLPRIESGEKSKNQGGKRITLKGPEGQRVRGECGCVRGRGRRRGRRHRAQAGKRTWTDVGCGC